MLDAITECLKKGDSCNLVGFGTFIVRDRAARKVVILQTGEDDYKLKLAKVAGFKAGKALKDAVQAHGHKDKDKDKK